MSPSLRGHVLLAALLAATVLAGCGPDGPPPLAGDHDFTMVYAQANFGNIEPCACNNRTTGGFPRRQSVLNALRAEGRNLLVLEGGNTLFTERFAPPEVRPQHREKAEAIASALTRLGVDAMTFGELDLSHGGNFLKQVVKDHELPMLAANVKLRKTGEPLFEAYRMFDLDGVKIAVIGLVSPELKRIVSTTNKEGSTMTQLSKDEVIYVEELFEDRDVEVEDPIEVAQDLVDELRGEAHLIVVLSHMPPKASREFSAVVPGVDVVVASHLPANRAEYDIKGRMLFLRTPMNGTVLGRADFHVEDGDLMFGDATQVHEHAETLPNLEAARADIVAEYGTEDAEQIAAVDPEISERLRMLTDAIAERAAEVRRERDEPRSSFVHRGVVLDGKEHVDDPEMQELVRAYRRGLADLYRDTNAPVDPVIETKPGTLAFTTDVTCVACHKPQAEFWSGTRHAHAWQTMLDYDAQYDLECITCHTVGYLKPGGFDRPDRVAKHVNVQCENCHGPGSFHVGGISFLDSSKIIGAAADMDCESCHNNEHSPDFQRETFVSRVSCPPIDHRDPLIRGALGQARAGMERALAKDDVPVRFFQAAIDLDVRLGNHEAALWMADRGLERYPDHGKLVIGAAWALDGLGRTGEAIARLHAASQRDAGDELVWKELARLLLHGRDRSARNLQAARACITYALGNFGEKDPGWRLLWAELLHAEGALDDAIAEADRIVHGMHMSSSPYTDRLEAWTAERDAWIESRLPPPLGAGTE